MTADPSVELCSVCLFHRYRHVFGRSRPAACHVYVLPRGLYRY